MIPKDRLLVETDSPYLAPTPHRGKRCEPGFVYDTAKPVAELRGEAFETLCAHGGEYADNLCQDESHLKVVVRYLVCGFR